MPKPDVDAHRPNLEDIGQYFRDVPAVWQQQAVRARELIARLGGFDELSPEEQRSRTLSLLIENLFRKYDYRDPIREDADLVSVGVAIRDSLRTHAPTDELPEGVFPQLTRYGHVTFAQRGPVFKALLPNRVAHLILVYGLTGENPMTLAAVAAGDGLNPNTVRTNTINATKTIVNYRNRDIHRLIWGY